MKLFDLCFYLRYIVGHTFPITRKELKKSQVIFAVFRKRHALSHLYLISLPKIAEITYTIYQRLSKRRLCKEYVGRKVNNSSRVNLRRNFAFVCTSSLSPRLITCLKPTIQSKAQYLDLKKASILDELLT